MDLSVCVRLRDINVSLASFSKKNGEEGDKRRGKRRKQEYCLATSVQQEVYNHINNNNNTPDTVYKEVNREFNVYNSKA